MENVWLYTLASVFIVSLISLIGIFTITLGTNILKKILLFLVSFSAGALLGDTFIHLIPEMAESGFTIKTSACILSGIILFFIIEKFLHWRHCHIPTSKQHPHPLAAVNLVGDGLHNFIDGTLIAGSYLVSVPLGISTTIAVILHEIPQEMGDFGVLLYAGVRRFRALFYNFLSALTAVLGAVLVLLMGTWADNISLFLIPFTAGGFIYIAGSDLIPELHKETAVSKSIVQLISILVGFGVMFALLLLE